MNGAAGGTLHVLMPGDVACADRGDTLETLLGSCVAVILTDQHRTVGAMCHIVHAGPPTGMTDKPCAHAELALRKMYQLLMARGFAPALCDAYVYGGGNMFPALVGGSHVGERNAECVLQRLGHEGVRVVYQDLGGTRYRRLRWTVGAEWPDVVAVEL